MSKHKFTNKQTGITYTAEATLVGEGRYKVELFHQSAPHNPVWSGRVGDPIKPCGKPQDAAMRAMQVYAGAVKKS